MQLSARTRKVPALFWIEQQQPGIGEDDLQQLSEEEQEEFWEEAAEEDLEDPPPRPVFANRPGETILCFFSSKERAWDFVRRYHRGGRYLTGVPRTLDDLQLNSSDDVDTLTALCEDVVSSPESVTGFSLNPPSDFLSMDSAELALGLTEMRQLIWQKAQEGGSPW